MIPTVGDVVPVLERRISLASMVAYAGATWDWYRIHYDAEFVREKGLPAPIVDGQVFGALIVEAVQDWLGPRCFVEQLSFTFRNMMFAGETVRIDGTVTGVGGDSVQIAARATILASEFGPERAAVEPAAVIVAVGRADGATS